MKKATLILYFFMISGMAVIAQNAGGMAHQKTSKTPEERAVHSSLHMQKRLGLDNNQTAQIKSINFEKAQKVEQIRTKYKDQPDKKAMHAELKNVKQETDSKYKIVMTPDQFSAWTQLREDHHRKMAEHRHKDAGKK